MGLKNAPGEFQGFMEHCLDGLRDDLCIPHIDDIVVFSQTFEDHVDHGCMNLGLSLNRRSADSLSGK